VPYCRRSAAYVLEDNALLKEFLIETLTKMESLKVCVCRHVNMSMFRVFAPLNDDRCDNFNTAAKTCVWFIKLS